jgi:hypothetical protein
MAETNTITKVTDDLLDSTPEDLAAQREARDAVMKIRQFPDLEKRLVSVFGPTAEALMLHQLIYWFSKPKMSHRWTMYKTFDEWYQERGLNRKQVDKGRARLCPSGVVKEMYGPHKRVHYRINWVRLAEILTVPPSGVSDSDCTPFRGDPHDRTPLRDSGSDCTPFRGDPPTQELTQELTTKAYVQENSFLQKDVDALSRTTPPQIHKDEPIQDGGAGNTDNFISPTSLLGAKNSSEVGKLNKRQIDFGSSSPEPSPPRLDKLKKNKVWQLLLSEEESETSRLADYYLEGKIDSFGEPFTIRRVADKVRETLGGDEPLEAYLKPVERGLESRQKDREATAFKRGG